MKRTEVTTRPPEDWKDEEDLPFEEIEPCPYAAEEEQYGLVKSGELLDWCWATDVIEAWNCFEEEGYTVGDGDIWITNLTALLV